MSEQENPYGEAESVEITEEKPVEAPSKEACTMAMLAHLLGLFSSFVGPLIIWLLKKDESPFVDEQAKEALNFQITLMIGFFISAILTYFCIGILTFFALYVIDVIFSIMATVAANKGESYKYPFNLRFIN